MGVPSLCHGTAAIPECCHHPPSLEGGMAAVGGARKLTAFNKGGLKIARWSHRGLAHGSTIILGAETAASMEDEYVCFSFLSARFRDGHLCRGGRLHQSRGAPRSHPLRHGTGPARVRAELSESRNDAGGAGNRRHSGWVDRSLASWEMWQRPLAPSFSASSCHSR